MRQLSAHRPRPGSLRQADATPYTTGPLQCSLKARLLSGIALSVVLGSTSLAAQGSAQASAQAGAQSTTQGGGGTAAAPLTPAIPPSGNGAPAKRSRAASDSGGSEEVIVTSQRRRQNLQDVPVSVQVLTGETLKRLNVENFDDLIKQLPNVTAGGFGPGQDNIYVRGLSIGGDEGGQGGGGVGSFPNVALYLDDQSAQIPGQNLDIYAVDLQRIEVLEGPQGTLFGSGAEAGVLRYITNKPNLDKYSVTVDGGTAGTEHGAESYNGDIVINAPIIKDKFAVRLVMYDDYRGGYIDNVPGTFVRQAGDRGIHYAGYTNNIPGPATPTNSINNAKLVANNINPATYQGIRGEALYQFDDDWSALLAESAQRTDADGVFYETPQSSGTSPVTLPDLSTQLYEPTSSKDYFENTALTINGRIGFLKLVYDGAYLVRNSQKVQDYTNYARGLYADYYQCQPANPAKGFAKPQCYSPGGTWQDIEHDHHLSQEFRVSTPENLPFRATGGFFYEDFKIEDQVNFDYLTAPGFTPIGPPPGSTANNPNTRPSETGFFNDITRGYTQYALFASGDYDIIPKVLTITGGTRWFDFHNYETGSAVSSFGCSVGYSGPTPCLADATNLDAKNLKSASYGFRTRANLTWKITPDIMVYYTYSQGYRPGGFNRRAPTSGSFVGPIAYQSDGLTNNEVGYKMQFLQHRVTLDGAFYQEKWTNVQDRLFDPGAFGNLAFIVNGPNYRVRGTELQTTVRVTHELTLIGGFAANDSRQLNSPPVTSATGLVLPGSEGIFGDVGDTLALSPALKGNIRARYTFQYRGFTPFFQIGATYQSHTHSAVSDFNNFEQKSYTDIDASMGVSTKAWNAQIFIDNLTDQRGQEFISAAQFVRSVVVTRPLTAGLRLSYTFE